MIASWLQFGRVEREPGPVDRDVDVLDLQRDPVEDRRDLVRPAVVGRDRQRRGRRVDFDLRADDEAVARRMVGSWCLSRSNGPAFAGLTIDRPNGAPL